jgi:putative molybdopterin biosynthesis protein
MPEIETTLGRVRRTRGFSAIRLAAAAGVSRQTIYAMEAGTYVPNTAVALRLARALETSVEALFALADDAHPPELRSELAMLLPGSSHLQPGQAVQLCQVDRRLMASAPSPVPWYFPAADAVVADKPERHGKTQVQIVHAESEFTNRILVAGCDPGI